MNISPELLTQIQKWSCKPQLYEPGEPKFWDDPHISKSMLEAHLDPSHDAASRKPETIDRTIEHLLSSGLLKPGFKVLDLGCGPGLYAERLCKAGMKVTGLDISQRSLDYARKHADAAGCEINYVCMNFFDMDYINEFDAVMQVYGEMCVFSDKNRDLLLDKIYKALKKDGIFIFDVTTRAERMKYGLKNGWYASNGGFWRPGKHILLEQGFDYPEEDVWLDQYIVVDDSECRVYRNWFHDYSLDIISNVLENRGFDVRHVWNDLTGSKYAEGGDWIALVAAKR